MAGKKRKKAVVRSQKMLLKRSENFNIARLRQSLNKSQERVSSN